MPHALNLPKRPKMPLLIKNNHVIGPAELWQKLFDWLGWSNGLAAGGSAGRRWTIHDTQHALNICVLLKAFSPAAE
jgi:predicted component of type VI protein secretion system